MAPQSYSHINLEKSYQCFLSYPKWKVKLQLVGWKSKQYLKNTSNNSLPHGGIWEICAAVNIFFSVFHIHSLQGVSKLHVKWN